MAIKTSLISPVTTGKGTGRLSREILKDIEANFIEISAFISNGGNQPGQGVGAGPTANSAAALRALSPNDLELYGYARLTGYRSGDNDGAGDFVWDYTSTETDDGGLWFKPDAVPTGSPGRVRRLLANEKLTPKIFGARGNYIDWQNPGNDDSDAFARMLTRAQAGPRFGIDALGLRYFINETRLPVISVPIQFDGSGAKLFPGDAFRRPVFWIAPPLGSLAPETVGVLNDGGEGYIRNLLIIFSRFNADNVTLRPVGRQHGIAMCDYIDNWNIDRVGIFNSRGWNWVSGVRYLQNGAWYRESTGTREVEPRYGGYADAFANIEMFCDNYDAETNNNLNFYGLRPTMGFGPLLRIIGRSSSKTNDHYHFFGLQAHGANNNAATVVKELAIDPKANPNTQPLIHVDAEVNIHLHGLMGNAPQAGQAAIKVDFSDHIEVPIAANGFAVTAGERDAILTLPALPSWDLSAAGCIRTYDGFPYLEIVRPGIGDPTTGLKFMDLVTTDTWDVGAGGYPLRTLRQRSVGGMMLRGDCRVMHVVDANTVWVMPFKGGFALQDGTYNLPGVILQKTYKMRKNRILTFMKPGYGGLVPTAISVNELPIDGLWMLIEDRGHNVWKIQNRKAELPNALTSGTYAGLLTAFLNADYKGPRVTTDGAITSGAGEAIVLGSTGMFDSNMRLAPSGSKIRVSPKLRGPVTLSNNGDVIGLTGPEQIDIPREIEHLVTSRRNPDFWLPEIASKRVLGVDLIKNIAEFVLMGAVGSGAEKRLLAKPGLAASILSDQVFHQRGTYLYRIAVNATQVSAPSSGTLDDSAHWFDIYALVRFSGAAGSALLRAVRSDGTPIAVTSNVSALIPPTISDGAAAQNLRIKLQIDNTFESLAVSAIGASGSSFEFTAHVRRIGGGKAIAEEDDTFTPPLEIGDFRIETQALISAMQVEPSRTLAELIDGRISALVDSGLWDKIGGLWCMAVHDAQAATLNWKNPSAGQLIRVNAPGFTAYRGFSGNGTNAWLNTGVAMNAIPNYSQNNAHLGIFALGNSSAFYGAGVAGGTRLGINPRVGSNSQWRINNPTTVNLATATAQGFLLASRREASQFERYVNGVAQPPVVQPSEDISALTNTLGFLRTLSSYADADSIVAWGCVGGGLTAGEVEQLNFIVSGYLTDIGAI